MPEIKEHDPEMKNESDGVNASSNAVVQSNSGSIMQQCEEISNKSKNSLFKFTLYSQKKKELSIHYTYQNFLGLDVEECFGDLKDSSGINFLKGIQARMKFTTNPKDINVKERHTVEHASGDSGVSSGISVIMVHTENGYIYIRYGGIKKTQTMKAKWLVKVVGYGCGVMVVCLVGFIAANWWVKNRENSVLIEENAVRDHELRMKDKEIAKIRAEKPIQNFFFGESETTNNDDEHSALYEVTKLVLPPIIFKPLYDLFSY
mmetsp:Transcript_70452/g.86448  ORF Transcript_70452/g.86448 Transcript_70452/m.86448 type:complete len:261 (+) Transcript_70452:76-858(+)